MHLQAFWAIFFLLINQRYTPGILAVETDLDLDFGGGARVNASPAVIELLAVDAWEVGLTVLDLAAEI